MTDQDDLDHLARRFVDLWQDQMQASARDPELAETMTVLLQAWARQGAAANAWWQGVLAGMPVVDPRQPEPASSGKTAGARDDGQDGSTAEGRTSEDGPRTTDAAGPEAAALASLLGPLDPDRLERRLAAIEERLARLESANPGEDIRPDNNREQGDGAEPRSGSRHAGGRRRGAGKTSS